MSTQRMERSTVLPFSPIFVWMPTTAGVNVRGSNELIQKPTAIDWQILVQETSFGLINSYKHQATLRRQIHVSILRSRADSNPDIMLVVEQFPGYEFVGNGFD